MSDFHIVVFFNDYYTLIIAFLTKQIQIQTSSRLSAGGVCIVVGGMHGGGGHALWQGDMRGIQRDTVNERAVRILLECILV